MRWMILFTLLAAGACSSDDPPPTFFEIGCGEEVPESAILTFVRESGDCGEVADVPYRDLNDDTLGCSLEGVRSEGDVCEVSVRCEGEVFPGQYYEIAMVFDYTAFPILGTGDLYVYEPDTGEECTGVYAVTIQ